MCSTARRPASKRCWSRMRRRASPPAASSTAWHGPDAMSFSHILFGFLLGLGPLIIIHELGHYFVARWCGVKVRRFSIGMGRVVWSRRFGVDQTEWALSVLPLGGYVKLVDKRDPSSAPVDAAEEAREFTSQNVW